MWIHEAEHGEGGNGREVCERNMAAIPGRTVQKGPNVTDSFNENIYGDGPEVIEKEEKEALRHIYNRKSRGCDGIRTELLKAGGEEPVKVMTGLCNCVRKRKEWPTDWKKSVNVPIYKKGDKQECGNYRTIALISHASKVLLRIIQRRLEVFLIPELPIEQAGFRRGRGTRDHIANLRWMMEKAREHQRDLYMCFIDYKKAFYCVDHERLGGTEGYGSASTPDSVTEKAVHQPGSDSQNGVWRDRQHRHWERRATGILSPLLFNIYAETKMREALEELESGISV